MTVIKKFGLCKTALLQALGVVAYSSLVAILFWKGNEIFGQMDNKYLGPLMFLTLVVTSVLVVGLSTLGYPIILIWKHKQVTKGVKLVAYTTAWLTGIILLLITSLILLK